MAPFSSNLRRSDPLRVSSAALGVAVILMMAAYGFGLTTSGATTESVFSAVAFVALAGSGLLYAWRLGAGGLVD